MKMLRWVVVLITALAVFAVWTSVPVTATQKYAKETGKKCTECHTKVPAKGAADPNLTDFGKAFQKNGHKLPS